MYIMDKVIMYNDPDEDMDYDNDVYLEEAD